MHLERFPSLDDAGIGCVQDVPLVVDTGMMRHPCSHFSHQHNSIISRLVNLHKTMLCFVQCNPKRGRNRSNRVIHRFQSHRPARQALSTVYVGHQAPARRKLILVVYVVVRGSQKTSQRGKVPVRIGGSGSGDVQPWRHCGQFGKALPVCNVLNPQACDNLRRCQVVTQIFPVNNLHSLSRIYRYFVNAALNSSSASVVSMAISKTWPKCSSFPQFGSPC